MSTVLCIVVDVKPAILSAAQCQCKQSVNYLPRHHQCRPWPRCEGAKTEKNQAELPIFLLIESVCVAGERREEIEDKKLKSLHNPF